MIALDISLSRNPIKYKNYFEELGYDAGSFSVFPLVVQSNIYIEPGCSAALPHGIQAKKLEGRVLIMPLRATLLELGLMIEVHPIEINQVIATSVFNMSNYRAKILENTVLSELVVFPQTPVKWKLVY